MRVQIFPTEKLKIEPWLINGWQSYGKFNDTPGVGAQVLWRPNGNLAILGNQYFLGADTLGNPDRKRFHTDDSIMFKYHSDPDGPVSKAAASFTFDAGCEYGGGVSCSGQYFLGFMAYNRIWFDRDRFAFTFVGGAIDNPGRYLVLVPPINGATAFSGTPYFTYNPGDQFKAWDLQLTGDYIPSPFVIFRLEFNYRHANVPYFSGPGGETAPGGNVAPPGAVGPGWTPDLRKAETLFSLALMIKIGLEFAHADVVRVPSRHRHLCADAGVPLRLREGVRS